MRLVKISKVAIEVDEEKVASMSDHTMHTDPLIDILTVPANENNMHAPVIVEAVEKYFQNVIFKGLFDIFRLGSSAMLITNR
jgi:hypothetical protein